MKRIYFTIILLLGAMVTLTYLYFSKLNRDTNNSEIALYAATAKSGLIFCFQNEKSIIDLLASQGLIQRLIPNEQLEALESLQQKLLGIPEINRLTNREMIYLSFLPDDHKDVTFLISTQSNENLDGEALLNLLKTKGIRVEKTDQFSKISLSDTSSFYLAQKNNLLLLSPSFKIISEALKTVDLKKNADFISYINSSHKLNRNNLAALYVNYNQLEGLTAAMSPERFRNIFPFFNQQNAFSNFSYSFSKRRILFNGSTNISKDNNYLHLFAANAPAKVTINAILPAQTASYTIYSTGNYAQWQQNLNAYFKTGNKLEEVNKRIQKINTKYRLDLNRIFPVYFKDQLLTFQLKNRETFGAINLSNGDKVSQLLLDISTEYSPEIKQLKEPMLLYSYFGDAFSDFNRPYYVIIDNYMVFSNYPSSLQVFLNSYRNNQQLIDNKSYISTLNQLSPESSISFYINHKNAANIARKRLFNMMYKRYESEDNLGKFDNFIYQMSGGDSKNFQTNILMSSDEELTDSIPSF